MPGQQSFNKLEALYHISNVLVSEHDLSIVLNDIIAEISKVGRYTIASLYMVEGKRLVLKTKLGELTSNIPENHSLTFDEGLVGKAFRSKKAVIINSISTDPTYLNHFQFPIESAISVPLFKGEEVYGVFMLASKKEGVFTEDHVSFLKAVAESASIAIHNALTFELLSVINQISSVFSSNNNVIQALPTVFRELQHLIPFNGLIVSMPHLYRLKEIVVFPFYTNHFNAQMEESFIPLEGSATELTLQSSEQYILATMNNTKAYEEDRFLESIKPSSVLRIPFKTGNNGIGVIHLYSQATTGFGERELKILKQILFHLTPTIQNVMANYQNTKNTLMRKLTQSLNNEFVLSQNVPRSLLKISRYIAKYMSFSQVLTWYMADEEMQLSPLHNECKEFNISFTDNHILTQTLLSKKSHYMSDLIDLSVIHPDLGHIKAKSILIIPLYDEIEQQMTGLMVAIDSKNANRFSKRSCEVTDASFRPLGSHIYRIIRNRRLERNNLAMIKALTIALDKKDSETEGHSERVVFYSVLISEKLGLSESLMNRIRWGALLHDIGKIGIPDAILKKPSKLNDEEWEVMRKHPEMGYEMIKGIEFLEEAVDIVLYHHEKFNGKGYPFELKGMDIPLPARVFAIADAFDAITSKRPYKFGLSIEEARNIIRNDSGTHFCPICVEAFLTIPYDELENIQKQYHLNSNIGERMLV